jgi:SNF2 family DNA or RNA helicase
MLIREHASLESSNNSAHAQRGGSPSLSHIASVPLQSNFSRDESSVVHVGSAGSSGMGSHQNVTASTGNIVPPSTGPGTGCSSAGVTMNASKDEHVCNKPHGDNVGQTNCSCSGNGSNSAPANLFKGRDMEKLPAFWEAKTVSVTIGKGQNQKQHMYFNVLTNTTVPHRPQHILGGILADEMGLGKTIQMITLMLAHPRTDDAQVYGLAQNTEHTMMKPPQKKRASKTSSEHAQNTNSIHAESQGHTTSPYADIHFGGTLVVCPAAVVSTWRDQIEKHTHENALRVETLRGQEQLHKYTPSELSKLDVVLVSYETLRSHFRRWATISNQSVRNLSTTSSPVELDAGDDVMTQDDAEEGSHVMRASEKTGASVAQRAQHAPKNAGLSNRGSARTRTRTRTSVSEKCRTKASSHSASKGSASAAAKGTQGTLFRIHWWRVVLDEGHVIRNRLTEVSKACKSLQAKHRWAMTGTPLQNRADDLFPMFEFLQVHPLCDMPTWKSAIARPLAAGDPIGITRLRVALRDMCLRRTKGVLGDVLPPKQSLVTSITVKGRHRETYDVLFRSAKYAFSALAMHGEAVLLQRYSSVLECLLRLRQACCSADLVPPSRISRARELLQRFESGGDLSGEGTGLVKAKLTADEAKGLLDSLCGLQDEINECAVCLDAVEKDAARVLRACKHCFCSQCLRTLLVTTSSQHSSSSSTSDSARGRASACPLCRCPFSAEDVLSFQDLAPTDSTLAANEKSCADGDENEEKEDDSVPPKVSAMINDLTAARKEDPTVKAVVFSHFIGFLDIIERALTDAGLSCARLQGGMRFAVRDAVLQSFASSDDPTVLLVSTKAGGVGLSLTRASRVYVMDLWWNAAVDEQAVDRVHRIGQMRNVTVTKLLCHDSIEQRLLDMQDRKLCLGTAALRRVSAEEMGRLRVQQLRGLFQVS